MDRDTTPDAADRLREAVRDAGIGRDALGVGASLDEVGGIGDVTADDGTAHVEVTLPVPPGELRETIERELRGAAEGVAGIDALHVEWCPAAADAGERADLLPGVRNVVAVSSGKGGVGKSTVAANLAAALADAGAAVGLLDADVYGPNAPALLGAPDAAPATTHDDRILPHEVHGVKTMSMGFVVGEDDPVIWRGPMVDDVIKQLTGDVEWGELDYLVVDLPPGTGDAQLTLVQYLPVTGAVVVTTPQAVAVDDARRGLREFARYDVAILGVVENMSWFDCPDCGGRHELFGAGGGEALADEFEVPLLGSIPLDPDAGSLAPDADDGRGITVPIVGRIGLPRTREERAGGRPPIAVRDDGGATRDAFRTMAARVAMRANLAAGL